MRATNGDEGRCRPALQSCVWELLRNCLGRCAEPNFTGCSGECSDSGGRGTSLLARENKPTSDDGSSNVPTDQILRRRSAHCLRILVEYERELLKRNMGSKDKGNIECLDAWMKYVLVFEMLEMEIELHLVEQVWPTVKELSSRVLNHGAEKQGDEALPRLIWEDIASILIRVLLSETPTLRKLGLYRLLSGDAGIDVSVYNTLADEDDAAANSENKVFMNKPKTKWRIKKDTGDQAIQSLPLSLVSVPFVLDVVIVSYDSIIGTKVGTNMQIDEGGNVKSESIIPLLSEFLSNYAIALAADRENPDRLNGYVNAMLSPSLIKGAKPRSLITFFSSLANALQSSSALCLPSPDLEQNTVRLAVRALLVEFSSGGAPQSLQDALKHDLAIVLQYSKPWGSPDMKLVLQVLALYPPVESSYSNTFVPQKARTALTSWLKKLGYQTWAENAASACCAAFIAGDLMPFVESEWLNGVNTSERELGMALVSLLNCYSLQFILALRILLFILLLFLLVHSIFYERKCKRSIMAGYFKRLTNYSTF